MDTGMYKTIHAVAARVASDPLLAVIPEGSGAPEGPERRVVRVLRGARGFEGARAFDRAATEVVAPHEVAGWLELTAVAEVSWGTVRAG
jgi:hypothetical protein